VQYIKVYLISTAFQQTSLNVSLLIKRGY